MEAVRDINGITKAERYRQREKVRRFEEVWDSFEWLIKEDLVKIDDRARNMIREMQLNWVPKDMIAELLPVYFERLKSQVIEEQEQHYRQGNSFHGLNKSSRRG